MNSISKKNSFLVSGEAGTGKSFFIRQEAKSHNAKLFRWNVRIDRSLREGREILHQQVRSKEPLYVWIEGADDLTQEAQAFLRRILETSSPNVVSMLEAREPWKLSPPILSRCIPICMNSKYSFRSIKNNQVANKYNLINVLKPLKKEDITLQSISKLRAQGYDPFDIIKLFEIDKNLLNMYRQIGIGCSPWIQLAYFIAAQ
uniref:ATPase AAA-type core domain-containing protein n=1 Tax=viral metagenome TaxID=1070528 RepID=A0A6C0D7P1_9ZZZZ